MSSLVHLVCGHSAGGAVEAALTSLGRGEDLVVVSRDAPSVGPLGDIDDGAAARVEWWTRAHVRRTIGWRNGWEIDDGPMLRRAVDGGHDVVVWHGTHPCERLFALRVCWWMRAANARLSEVVLDAPRVSSQTAFFIEGVGAGPVERLIEAWATRRAIDDIAERALDWLRLRDGGQDGVRELLGARIIERPIDTHDGALVGAANRGSTNTRSVVGDVLTSAPVGAAFLFWRVATLLDGGPFEGRGHDARLGLPSELRARPSRT